MSDPTQDAPLQAAESPAVPVPAAGALVPAKRKRRQVTSLREYAESLLVTVLLALFGTSFVVQAFKIPSPSMEPTLLVGDHLLVNKFVYGGRGAWYDALLPYREIQRGEVIVFKFPFDDHAHYVKRVIAVPGDRLKITDQQVYVNGRPLDEPYKVHDPAVYDPFGDNFPPADRFFLRRNVRSEWAEELLRHVQRNELVVPPQKYFVMGDNRDHSWDSRYWGFVDREAVMGRPVMIYWSVDATSDDYADRTLGGRLIGLAHAFTRLPVRTRWARMFRSVR
ncbi:MAG: signal peptidase I [Acidobacteria bacterium]|nr:signal peptidase I [Acidobacteriota bacterium]MCL5289152.1 signal peptidase I [Acidobacteriota bacterium]